MDVGEYSLTAIITTIVGSAVAWLTKEFRSLNSQLRLPRAYANGIRWNVSSTDEPPYDGFAVESPPAREQPKKTMLRRRHRNAANIVQRVSSDRSRAEPADGRRLSGFGFRLPWSRKAETVPISFCGARDPTGRGCSLPGGESSFNDRHSAPPARRCSSPSAAHGMMSGRSHVPQSSLQAHPDRRVDRRCGEAPTF